MANRSVPSAEWVKPGAIGAVPATVPAPETYSLVERGAVYASGRSPTPTWLTTASFRLVHLEARQRQLPVGGQHQGLEQARAGISKVIMEAKLAYGALKKAYADKDAVNLPMLRKELTGVYSDADSPSCSRWCKPIWDAWIAERRAMAFRLRAVRPDRKDRQGG